VLSDFKCVLLKKWYTQRGKYIDNTILY
jgi:hypothetical protein